MAAEPARLLQLADAIAEGRDVDWGEAEATAGSADDREIIAQLRLLAGVADVHRHGTDDSAEERPLDPLIGTQWGALEIRGVIGAGSFGSVYRAYDPQLDREVALKLIRGASNEDEVLREGRQLARIRHPHVVTVYGADRIGGQVGLWMELIRGRTLADILREQGPMNAREASIVGADLCQALAAVHAQGLLHRDLKAQNVMREDGGRIVLMDFGATLQAADADTAGPVGTPAYMAPEVLRGEPASRVSDIYSLGVLLYRLATGRFPVEGATKTEITQQHVRGPVRIREIRPDLPAGFADTVDRAISALPTSRPQSAVALERALQPGSAIERRRSQVAAGTLALMAIVAASWWAWPRQTPLVTDPRMVIGVRPLENLTGDADQDYAVRGLSQGLVAAIGSIDSLTVIDLGQATASAVAGLARERDATLEGGYQRSGDRLRVTVRLLEASTSAVLWGRTFEGASGDQFAIEGRIASELARAIGVALTDADRSQLTTRYVVNPEAESSYLRGRFLHDQLTVPALQNAREELERAVALDPGFASAHASLALVYMSQATIGAIDPSEARRLAPPVADAAYRLGPGFADVVLARAEVRFRLMWDWAGARADYDAALALNPNDLQVRSRYARFLAAAGEVTEGLRIARESLSIDPLSTEMHNVVGFMLYYDRQYQASVDHYRERHGISASGHTGLGRSLAAIGDRDGAVAELRTAYDRNLDPSVLAELGRTFAQFGERAEAEHILETLSSDRRAPQTTRKAVAGPQDLAYILAALGRHEAAIDQLETAVTGRESRLLWLGIDPRVDVLRSHPRFIGVLNQLGIPVNGNH